MCSSLKLEADKKNAMYVRDGIMLCPRSKTMNTVAITQS